MTLPSSKETAEDPCRDALRELIELQREQLVALNYDGQRRLAELASAFEVLVSQVSETKNEGVTSGAVGESLGSAVRTLQFADNQAQRLEHLIRALDQMASLLTSPAADDESSWQALRTGLRAGYTMERECEVFDRLFAGPTGGAEVSPRAAAESSVELF